MIENEGGAMPYPNRQRPPGKTPSNTYPDYLRREGISFVGIDGVEVKPKPASVGQGGSLDLRDPSHSMPQTPNPADLAADVLDAMTRKLADYDRLSAALTSAQEAATKNLERARRAEDERNTYRASVESYAGRKLWESEQECARLREQLDQAQTNFAQAARSGACAVGQVEGIEELLGLEAGADVIGAVGRLRERARASEAECAGLYRARIADVATLGVTPLRAAKPGPRLTPLAFPEMYSEQRYSMGRQAVCGCSRAEYGPVRLVAFMSGSAVAEWAINVAGDEHRAWYRGHAMPLSALADVNAILARYGYALEQWP